MGQTEKKLKQLPDNRYDFKRQPAGKLAFSMEPDYEDVEMQILDRNLKNKAREIIEILYSIGIDAKTGLNVVNKIHEYADLNHEYETAREAE